MQPTTNTPFERFAFIAVILLTFCVPFFFVLLACMMSFGISGPVVQTAATILAFVSAFAVPVFSIIFATKIERDHIKALAKAEAELSDIVVSDMKTLPPNWNTQGAFLVTENVVIANDYFKSLLWVFRNIFGGESKSFSKLVSRARREATVRVLRRAKEYGANVVWNIRYETSVIQLNGAKNEAKTPAGVEVLAYATAFTVKPN